MGQFYKTSRGNFLQGGIFSPNMELANKVLSSEQSNINQVGANINALGDINFLYDNTSEIDTRNAKLEKEKYFKAAKNLTDSINQDISQYKKFIPKIQQIGSKLKSSMNEGNIFKLQTTVINKQKWLEANKDKNMKLAFAIKQAEDIRHGGDSITNGPWKAEDVGELKLKEIYKELASLKPDKSTTFDFKRLDAMGIGVRVTKNKTVELNEDDVVRYLINRLASDPENNLFLTQASKYLNDDITNGLKTYIVNRITGQSYTLDEFQKIPSEEKVDDKGRPIPYMKKLYQNNESVFGPVIGAALSYAYKQEDIDTKIETNPAAKLRAQQAFTAQENEKNRQNQKNLLLYKRNLDKEEDLRSLIFNAIANGYDPEKAIHYSKLAMNFTDLLEKERRGEITKEKLNELLGPEFVEFLNVTKNNKSSSKKGNTNNNNTFKKIASGEASSNSDSSNAVGKTKKGNIGNNQYSFEIGYGTEEDIDIKNTTFGSKIFNIPDAIERNPLAVNNYLANNFGSGEIFKKFSSIYPKTANQLEKNFLEYYSKHMSKEYDNISDKDKHMKLFSNFISQQMERNQLFKLFINEQVALNGGSGLEEVISNKIEPEINKLFLNKKIVRDDWYTNLNNVLGKFIDGKNVSVDKLISDEAAKILLKKYRGEKITQKDIDNLKIDKYVSPIYLNLNQKDFNLLSKTIQENILNKINYDYRKYLPLDGKDITYNANNHTIEAKRLRIPNSGIYNGIKSNITGGDSLDLTNILYASVTPLGNQTTNSKGIINEDKFNWNVANSIGKQTFDVNTFDISNFPNTLVSISEDMFNNPNNFDFTLISGSTKDDRNFLQRVFHTPEGHLWTSNDFLQKGSNTNVRNKLNVDKNYTIKNIEPSVSNNIIGYRVTLSDGDETKIVFAQPKSEKALNYYFNLMYYVGKKGNPTQKKLIQTVLTKSELDKILYFANQMSNTLNVNGNDLPKNPSPVGIPLNSNNTPLLNKALNKSFETDPNNTEYILNPLTGLTNQFALSVYTKLPNGKYDEGSLITYDDGTVVTFNPQDIFNYIKNNQ